MSINENLSIEVCGFDKYNFLRLSFTNEKKNTFPLYSKMFKVEDMISATVCLGDRDFKI